MTASHNFFRDKTAGHGQCGWVACKSPKETKGPSCAQKVLAAFGGCGTAPGGSFRSLRGYGNGSSCWERRAKGCEVALGDHVTIGAAHTKQVVQTNRAVD